ncbi:hypothetical protein [Dyella nitratireducens]|uniref:Uncharacterized protein n=1 Tax=Dyella nitratireducens TaxID=1849580 RepID=A0ABQ1FLQ0_9GAMM|nr:hypothetical protein [Dyella nitratireducens]GGA19743.1 hypothetical protein GCM10010981_04680 [Dyella nitratireducens]GLQ44470.1 hypothetical protein GCM10007902_43200 [Dyella nitratireducens]
MSMPSISNTLPPSVSGRFAIHDSQYKKELRSSPASTPAVSTDSSAAAAEPMASAIAAALTQLGLVPTANVAGSDNTATASDAAFASLPLQQKVSPQIQQYRNMASAFSGLAQALSDSSSSTPSAVNGAGNLTSVFQSLWTSLGSSSGMAPDASSGTMPSLPSFLGSLARNLSESGVTGLRGVFIDTVA